MRSIISSKQFKKDEVELILSDAKAIAEDLADGAVDKVLKDKIVACIFYEPSTRTRLSFETAAQRLGAQVISMENAGENSSAHKGETIEDTAKILSGYADIIVMRHPESGSLERASRVSHVPIINAGDGPHEHPSQGLLDLYTIKKELGRTENLKIGFAGDLLYSRTLRSLVPLLQMYSGNKFYFLSPKELELPREYVRELAKNGAEIIEGNYLEQFLPELDILYMTRVQKERFKNLADYEKVKNIFIFKKEHLNKLKKEAIIMHPLPKINEIEPEVDLDPRAAYFRQAENGLYVRMALLVYALGL